MNLYLKIKDDQLTARRLSHKNVTKVLTMLLSEADSKLISKKSESEQHELMLDIILKYEKSLIKNIETFSANKDYVDELEDELEIIQKYLPKKLTEEQIIAIISNEKFDNFGNFMKYLSSNYKGLFDSKQAKVIWENYQ